MRIRFGIAAFVCVSAIAAIGVAAAVGSSGSRAAPQATFQVVVTRALLTYVDLGESGESVGDMLVQDSRLFNRALTRRLGHSPISCVFVSPRAAPRCNADAVFARGTIALQGVLDQPTFVFAVVGGTGIFRNARGEAHGRVLRRGNRVLLTFRLQGVGASAGGLTGRS
jgi:hypothetical protein